ncbi:MAG: UDP-N-acetylmuramoyl-L-alanyl-D-glutamate--2,6-diaminopimelate ligase [Chlorobiaceae bacterium]|nr:UDP-N-acetylmuramoyl-L-alanyl-D-glutamate--2,6-diaminopimelate ligase [Chlorobiaceae bacterium]
MTSGTFINSGHEVSLKALVEAIEHLAVAGSISDQAIVRKVTCDSREIVAGAVFVAIKGYSADGHRFIGNAVECGAVAVICEEFPADKPGNCFFIKVANARKALAEAARIFYGKASDRLLVIGVTGTNGKTTTSRLITSMLNANGIPAGYIGTNLCRIGDRDIVLDRTTPEADLLHSLFARMLDEGCKAVVMEVSSHALMLWRVFGIRFHAAVFTNLTMEHLDFHETMQEYAAAKQLLFEQLSPGGFAVFNIDDPYAGQMMSKVSPESRFCCTVMHGNSDREFQCNRFFSAEVYRSSIDSNFVDMHFPDTRVSLEVHLPGSYNVMNVLEAAAIGYGLGLDPQAVSGALASVSSVEGRMERIGEAGTGYNVFVDYAHTPDALQKALETLRRLKSVGSRLFVVFGCGGDRDRSKRPEMGRIASETADKVILTSDNPRSEDPDVILDEIERGITGGSHIRINDRREALVKVLSLLQEGDILLVAGKGHEKYQEIKGRKEYFSDQEILRNTMSNMNMRQHHPGSALKEKT